MYHGFCNNLTPDVEKIMNVSRFSQYVDQDVEEIMNVRLVYQMNELYLTVASLVIISNL